MAPGRRPDGFAAVDLAFLVRHFTGHVRSRGTLPTLRIGRQPYGLLPVTSLDLWRGEEVDERIVDHVRSFATALQEQLFAVPQVGAPVDQDAAILDLLGRQAASTLVELSGHARRPDGFTPFPGTVVGSVPAGTQFAASGPAGTPGLLPWLESPAAAISPELAAVIEQRPLAAQAQILEQLRARLADWDPHEAHADLDDLQAAYEALDHPLIMLGMQTGAGLFYSFARCVRGLWGLTFLGLRVARYRAAGMTADDDQMVALDEEEWRRFEHAEPAFRRMLEHLVALEAGGDLPHVERLLCETLDTLSHRVDAWALSLPAARLERLRAEQPDGVRIGA